MRLSFLLILALITTNLSAQSDAEHPFPLQSTVLEATTHGEGGNSYYQFAAGPGDITISVQAGTDYYSSPLELELLSSEGKSIGTINLVATDAVGRATRTFRFPSRDNAVLKVATNSDSHVKWLKYRIALKGAVELQAPGTNASPAQAAEPATVTVPSPAAAEPVVADQPALSSSSQSTPAQPTAAAAGETLSLATLAQALGSISSLPSKGTLRIDMKDGTVRLIPLTGVLRMSVVKAN